MSASEFNRRALRDLFDLGGTREVGEVAEVAQNQLIQLKLGHQLVQRHHAVLNVVRQRVCVGQTSELQLHYMVQFAHGVPQEALQDYLK